MTPVAFALNGALMLLLLFALFVGLRLERRLRGLRDSQASFAKAAQELNAAIAGAEAGLSDIRKLVREADETLTERVDEARAAAKKLEQAMTKAVAVQIEAPSAPAARETSRPVLVAAAPRPTAAAVDDDMSGLPIKDLLARLRGSLPLGDAPPAHPAAALEPATARSRARVDDDLFDSPDAFPPLRRAGAAR